MRAALIKDGTVCNVIEVAETWTATEWDGYQVIISDECEIGDIYDGQNFIHPPKSDPPSEKSKIEKLEQRIADLEAKLAEVVKK